MPAYTVGAIVAGWFFGGPIADYWGRRVGMAIGAILVIIATFMQTFTPHHKIGVFIAGRVIIGMGQGVALSKLLTFSPPLLYKPLTFLFFSCWTGLHQ